MVCIIIVIMARYWNITTDYDIVLLYFNRNCILLLHPAILFGRSLRLGSYKTIYGIVQAQLLFIIIYAIAAPFLCLPI